MRRAQGDLKTAVEMLESCLEAEKQILGREHPGTLTTSLDLAATLHMQGEVQRAKRLLRETLEAQRRTLGPAHPRTLTTQRAQRSLLAAERLDTCLTVRGHRKLAEMRSSPCMA